jgi:putative MATE family efflux protein
MVAQAAVGLIETFWVSRLGSPALAGMALVFPGYMMMTMLSSGAMGGGISSAVARALGGRRQLEADALVLHAVVISASLGVLFSVLFLIFGRDIYAALGASGESLEAALAYSNVVFAGAAMLWLFNGLGSVLRGTGAIAFVSAVNLAGVLLLIPLSPLLIYGWGSLPGFGMAGAGMAVLVSQALALAILIGAFARGRSLAKFRIVPLRWPVFADILRVGVIASVNSMQTTATVAITTALVARAGGEGAVAGFGTASRLEYLMIPMVFGVGAPLVAMVGTNVGAGQKERALRVALIGGAICFGLTETLGLLAAIFPQAWLGLFGRDAVMIATGAAYLHRVGPVYGFFGLGLSLYFASQGAGRLKWPLITASFRLAIAAGGGWLALWLTQSVDWVFVSVAGGLVVYGGSLGVVIARGGWFGRA